MNLLIVDDEINMLRFVTENLDTEGLGIRRLFTAQNITDAKQILRNQNIDILVSDIEMPLGSGLELVEWANAHQYPSTNIIITCHNDFEFAKKAIALGIFSYILKPFPIEELEKTLQAAVLKQREKRLLSAVAPPAPEDGGLPGVGNEQDLRLLLLNGEFPPEAEEDGTFHMMLVFRAGQGAGTAGNEDLHLRSRISFLLSAHTESYRILRMGDGSRPHLAILLDAEELSREEVLLIGNSLLQMGEIPLQIFYHTGLGIRQLREAYASGLRIAEGSLSVRFGMTDLALLMRMDRDAPISLPDMNRIRLLLQRGDCGQMIAALTQWEYGIARDNILNKRAISAFLYAYEALVFQTAGDYGVDTEEMTRKLEPGAAERAQRSLADFHGYVTALGEALAEGVREVSDESPVIQRVTEFIRENYVNDLSMNEIAEHAGMSRDHLTKIFARSQGMTPMDYLSAYRIEQAKKMLLLKDVSISETASLCGFNSSSYFCKVFRQSTGMSPKDFRKKG